MVSTNPKSLGDKGGSSLYRVKSAWGVHSYRHMVAGPPQQQGCSSLGASARTGMMPLSVEVAAAAHIVSGSVLFPGVGYAEVAFALTSAA